MILAIPWYHNRASGGTGGSRVVLAIGASVAHTGGWKGAGWLRLAFLTGVPVSLGSDVVSCAELDSGASGGHTCGGRCVSCDPCSSGVGAVGSGVCGAWGAPRCNDDRCIRGGDGDVVYVRTNVDACIRSARVLDEVLALCSAPARRKGVTAGVGPLGCSYSCVLVVPESNANEYNVQLYAPELCNDVGGTRLCGHDPPQGAQFSRGIAVGVMVSSSVACGSPGASGSDDNVARGSAVIFFPRVFQAPGDVYSDVGSYHSSSLGSSAMRDQYSYFLPICAPPCAISLQITRVNALGMKQACACVTSRLVTRCLVVSRVASQIESSR